ncbi:MAG: long-chain fatty acid--CoA ligase [bacterium]|nr:long-chain fatty acid--CoA ligase [candidate division KSB1 bacterium]MDH7558693.1 long-chain fatty acid--CoA ligase [bacterium]
MERPWLTSYDQAVSRTLDVPGIPITHLLSSAVTERPGGTAIHFLGRAITYRELGSLVDRLASALHRLGVRRGERVAIVLPNIPQYVVAHWATLQLGALVVPTNPLYTERELAHQLHDSGAETVVILDLLLPRLQRIRQHLPIKSVIVASISDFLPPVLRLLYSMKRLKDRKRLRLSSRDGLYHFREVLSWGDGLVPQVDLRPEDTAILLYTGGTTGLAKGAELTHVNLVANALQARRWVWDIKDGQEVILTVLPLFHSYAMTACHHLAIQCKSAMVLLPRFEPMQVIKAIHRYRVTIFPGVPTMYVAINHHPKANKFDLASVRVCISGGAPLPVEVQTKFEQLTGGRLVEGYGLSECSPVTHCNPIHGKRKAGSIGLPWPGTDARVVDLETRRPVPTGQVGELLIRGPQVMKGYWRNPEETAQVLQNGWLATGDIARMDEEGFFYIVDRKKDMIVTGGLNVYPREVEEVLYEHPCVHEAAAIGVPDEYYGERVKVYIVPKAGAHLSADEILRFCQWRLAKFKLPKEIEFRDALPKSLIGKVLRRELLAEHLAQLSQRSSVGGDHGKEKE